MRLTERYTYRNEEYDLLKEVFADGKRDQSK